MSQEDSMNFPPLPFEEKSDEVAEIAPTPPGPPISEQADFLSFPTLIFEDEAEKVAEVAPTTPPRPPISEQEKIDRLILLIGKEHAHIGKGLTLMWGYPECEEYLQKLIHGGYDTTRELKVRAGFNPAVFAALMDLAEIHKVVRR